MTLYCARQALGFSAAAALVVLLSAGGCAHVAEGTAGPVRGTPTPELRELEQRGLAVEGERVQFEGHLDVPPTLRGVPTTTTVKLVITPGRHLAVEEVRGRMRAAATGNARVSGALGTRSSLLTGGWLDVDKGQVESDETDRYRLVFYAYERNRIVSVILSSRGEVIAVRDSAPAVQPPESREEVDAAAAIVRADRRYAVMQDWLVRGIQTHGAGGHRHLYVSFHTANRTRAVYEATVDMTAGRVVSARDLRRQGTP